MWQHRSAHFPRLRPHLVMLATSENGSSEDVQQQEQEQEQERPRFRGDDAVETVAWGGTLPSGRRVVVGGLSGLLIGTGVSRLRE